MQYMISGSMMLVPVQDGGESAEYCLPSGLWTDFFTGKEYEGGRRIKEQMLCENMPLMIRENSIVAVIAHDENGYDNACYENWRSDDCELRVYAVRDNMKLDMDIYGADEGAELSVSVKRRGRTITVTADGRKPYTLRMVNMRAKSAVNGFLTVEGSDSVITPDRGASVIEITF